MIVVKDSPQEDPRITDSELRYITESLKDVETNKPAKIPWKSFVTSMPVWAITASHFSENWGFYTMLTQLPKYMKRKTFLYFFNFVMAFKAWYFALTAMYNTLNFKSLAPPLYWDYVNFFLNFNPLMLNINENHSLNKSYKFIY
nr:unnamed protein product [Callosobruchus analis]